MARLAGDLLLLARSDSGLPLEHRAELDLLGLVRRVARRFESAAAARNVSVSVSGGTVVVSGDERLLERVVGNLIGNAVSYSRSGGMVAAEISRKDTAELVVRDEGPGIPPEQVPHLFERFFRGDPARQRGEGSGLGLAIARAGAEAHGGKLEFLGNTPGACFRLTLPASRLTA